MICVKIYLDADKDGREMLVFESTSIENDFCRVGNKITVYGMGSQHQPKLNTPKAI